MIHLGMVSTFNVKCGLSTYATYLSEALIKNGVDVTVLAEHPFPDDSSLSTDIKTNVPFFYSWKRTEFYDRLIKESSNYDVIHFQHQFGLFNNTYAWIKLLKSFRQPTVITVHDIVPPNEQLSTYFSETFSSDIVKKLIVHTNTCYSMLLSWNCPKDKIELIPHGTKIIGVPTKSEARKELGLPEDAKIILSWGFIWESKGILDLIKILAEVKNTYPEAMFVHAGGLHPIVTGGSGYVQQILKTALKLNLGPKDLIITDWLPEDKVPTWFGAADLIVLNYMRGSASASGAAHRTLSAHRPIVGTDDPCIEDIPKLTVPRFSPSELYNGIIKVLSDESLQKDLVKQAETQAMETSWNKVALKHKKIYERLV